MQGYMTCSRCPARAITDLDGEPLCEDHADEWTRGQAPDLIQPEDDAPTFADKFATSLEEQAQAMEDAIESFVDYPNVRGGLMACRSWLRRTADAIRDEIG